ncbi:SGNH/GDSL hydrolase family protein [Nocardia sp. NPDC051463]|uniref:SGNH/GDSL hydrolase family protein n=1 Tax=Nocardia sp. NPDC051463 TaxID=3154845 RepID=UPI0034143B5F
MQFGVNVRGSVRTTRLFHVILSAVTVALLGGSAAVASAEPEKPPAAGKSLVVIGDSYTANGVRLNGDEKECRRGPSAWPTQLSQLMGIHGTPEFMDVSCSGASIQSQTAYNLIHEARLADKAGAFGPNTKVVAIQLGMNDTWGTNKTMLWTAMDPCILNLTDGCGLEAAEQGRSPDYRAVTGKEYADRIRTVIDYIRYYAPQARIVLVGYPELVPAQTQKLCVNILGVGAFVQDRGAAVVEYMDRLDRAQREAAEILKLEFFNAKPITAGHGLCSQDPWVNGVFDPRADFLGMPLHPTAKGDAVMAAALRDWISK